VEYMEDMRNLKKTVVELGVLYRPFQHANVDPQLLEDLGFALLDLGIVICRMMKFCLMPQQRESPDSHSIDLNYSVHWKHVTAYAWRPFCLRNIEDLARSRPG
jgi:hypothetical protein